MGILRSDSEDSGTNQKVTFSALWFIPSNYFLSLRAQRLHHRRSVTPVTYAHCGDFTRFHVCRYNCGTPYLSSIYLSLYLSFIYLSPIYLPSIYHLSSCIYTICGGSHTSLCSLSSIYLSLYVSSIYLSSMWSRVFLHSSGCSETHYVDKAGTPRDPPALASLVLGLEVYIIEPGFFILNRRMQLFLGNLAKVSVCSLISYWQPLWLLCEPELRDLCVPST